jgi:tripeptidyl-peptidase I
MRFTAIGLGAFLLGITHGRVIGEGREFEVFEELHVVPEGWKAAGSPHPDTRLNFRIALNAAKPELLEKALYEISTPGNAKYGQHLERHELKAILEPSPAGCSMVLDWLKTSGVKDTDIENRGEWVNFVATAKQANMLMDTNYLVYRSLDDEDPPKIRTTKVSLPRNVKEHIKMIHPSTRFTKTKAQMSQIFAMSRIEEDLGAVDASCNSTITPTCLRELYSVKGVTIQDPKKVGFVGVAGFLKQYARFDDLHKFVGDNAKWASATNFTWSGVNGKQIRVPS